MRPVCGEEEEVGEMNQDGRNNPYSSLSSQVLTPCNTRTYIFVCVRHLIMQGAMIAQGLVEQSTRDTMMTLRFGIALHLILLDVRP